MLRGFLLDAAKAFEATGNDFANNVAVLLKDVRVPVDWRESLPHNATSRVLQQLPEALGASDCHPAAQKLANIAEFLNWQEAVREMPKSFVGNYCFVVIVGPGGMIQDDRFRFGVYLQSCKTFYPSHKHEAVELYLPLSGTANWQRQEEAFKPVNPGTLIHHPSYLCHATHTLDEPMLALWSWTGNLSFDTYSIVGG